VHLPRFLCEQLAAYLAERPTAPTICCSLRRRVARWASRGSSPASSSQRRPPGWTPDRLRFQGASVEAVQAQLGHASATVTLDHDGHLFPDELQQLADRLQDAYVPTDAR
jgi:integrase